jgi:hypothetical protein
MDSRICPSASHDENWFTKIGAECFFNAFLYSKGILLDLPSVKWTSMVAEFQKIAVCRLVHAAAKILFPINSTVEICFLDIPG